MNWENKQDIKVALVTGGARRIGAAIVTAFHEAGFKVVIHCRHSFDEAKRLAAKLNAKRKYSVFVVQKDLTEQNAAELISEAVHWAGRLDVLVNNASIFTRSTLDDVHEEDWHSLFTIHVRIPFILSLAAQPFLAENQGAIINLTDIHADKPLKGYAIYCQSKAALNMQTKALARELAPDIRVNAVAPGAIVWPEGSNVLNAEEQQKILHKTLLKNHGNPHFVAQAVLALAQNEFITGQILNVDGGRSLT